VVLFMMQMPHPLDRRYQLESYQRIINSPAKFVIIRLKPGIGKTALAAQAACDGYRVMACVMTKSLQWQYVDPYGFTEIFGKGNYACSGFGQQYDIFDFDTRLDIDTRPATADLCEVPDEFKATCKRSCEYPLARNQFISAQAGVTNYSKFLSDRSVVNSIYGDDHRLLVEGFDPEILFYDECHLLHDEVIKWSGLSFKWSSKRLMNYCQPIEIDIDRMNVPLPVATQKVIAIGMRWLQDLLSSLKYNPPKHPSKGGEVGLYKWWKRKVDKVDVTIACLSTAPEEWHIYADKDGITLKPKTARFHFRQLFDKAPKMVLMSGTIQRMDTSALGLEPGEFELIEMPNPFPPAMRPVYDLNCPKITAKTSLSTARQHAQIIANVFNSKPDYWNGIVHMPSKKKSEDWGEWLQQMTGRPVWVPPREISTDKAWNEWVEFEAGNTGAVACCWQFQVGVDGKNININITGDVPYPNFGDRFEKAKFDYNPGEARVRVANNIEQQQYRNRRGFDEHYGPNAEKFNAVAGGEKMKRLRSAFDRDFWKAIIRQQ
jgi:hypothetical protein